MTITMVELQHRAARRPRPAAMPAAVALALMLLAPASRADWQFTPHLLVRETYSDNVALRPNGQSNWITELAPSLSLAHQGPRLQMSARYTRSFFEYADKDVVGTQSGNQNLSATAKAKIVDEMLFVDTNASISQREVSAFGPLLQNNGNNFASANASEVKTVRVSPYLLHRFGTFATSELRYSYDRMTTSTAGLNNSTGNTLSLNVASGNAFRELGWGVQAAKSEQKGVGANSAGSGLTNENYAVSLRWRTSAQLTMTATRGYDSYDYESLGGSNGGPSWLIGADWQPGVRTRVQISAGKRYYGNSYALNAQYRARQSVWTLTYNDAVTSTRQQFVLPAAIDTFSLLDRLFASTIVDPAARRQAVEAYMLATGLPTSLAENINYFSNRYSLQKQFQAAAAFNGAHSTLVVSLQDMRRNALSSASQDSGLLGSTTTNLNDNVRQTGGTVTANWRLSSRTGVVAAASINRMHSSSANLSSLNRNMQLSLTHQLQRKLRASVDLRRHKGGLGNSQYTENAVSATLSKQF